MSLSGESTPRGPIISVPAKIIKLSLTAPETGKAAGRIDFIVTESSKEHIELNGAPPLSEEEKAELDR